MHYALEWARKRDKPTEFSGCIVSPAMMRRSISFVTDRTATLMTMMRYKSLYGAQTNVSFSGFPAAMHLCSLSLVKLLLCVGRATFYHKRHCPSQCDIRPKDWAPDILAGKGCEHGRSRLELPVVDTSFHLLKWSDQQMEGSLLVSVTVGLESIDDALVFVNCKSINDFLRRQCQKARHWET